jgi:hypothetical protein
MLVSYSFLTPICYKTMAKAVNSGLARFSVPFRLFLNQIFYDSLKKREAVYFWSFMLVF